MRSGGSQTSRWKAKGSRQRTKRLFSFFFFASHLTELHAENKKNKHNGERSLNGNELFVTAAVRTRPWKKGAKMCGSCFCFFLFSLLSKVAACCRGMNERQRERNLSHLLSHVRLFVESSRSWRIAGVNEAPLPPSLPPPLLFTIWLWLWAEPVGGGRRRRTGRRREPASASPTF